MLISLEATNLNSCVYFGILDAIIGGAFGGGAGSVTSTVDSICSMFSFFQIDVFEFYFSPKGAMIGALIFPSGASLKGEVSIFGQKLAAVKGAIEIEKLRAQFDASIASIDLLGIIELTGKQGQNLTFGFVVAPGEVSVYADGKLSLFKGLRSIEVRDARGRG